MSTARECQIQIRPEEAKELVNVSSKCDFDIDVFYNHYVIDAKSILGVLALDFTKQLTVRYYGQNYDLEKFLGKFTAIC